MGTTRVGVAGLISALLVAGCSSSSSTPVPSASGRGLSIVAGENFWGSIATQLAGKVAHVESVVTDPNADPHQYESSVADARLFADANYVVVNGAGYDSWAAKLLSGNPSSHRQVLDVAALLGKKDGDNPHFWYNPDYVTQVADRITADLKQLDPADAVYLDDQRRTFDAALQPMRDRLAAIKALFAATPVGATESIFVYLAQYLGLDLISPPEFMRAVAEGNDPPAPTVAQFQDQVSGRQIKVLVFNEQTVTAVMTNLKALAAQRKIPTVGITETQPMNATFQDWQTAQLQRLQDALAGVAT